MAKLASQYMERHGTRFLQQCFPQRIDRDPTGRLIVQYTESGGDKHEEAFDTVLVATGAH